MLSKEEIESVLKDISNGFREFKSCDNYLYPLNPRQFNIITNYINQLESREQKLIEKLECAIDFGKTGTDVVTKIKIECLENVLKILKGENDE